MVLVLLAMAGCGRDTTVATGAEGTVVPGGVGDHWHTAFAVWDCDRFLPPFADRGEDRKGVHSHVDGLIHLHPFTEEATGDEAVLGLFLDQVGIDTSSSELSLPGGRVLQAGADCDGQPGELVTLRWADVTASDPPQIEDRAGRVPLRDCSAVVLAFRAPGADVGLPPAVTAADGLSDVGSGSLAELCATERGDGQQGDGSLSAGRGASTTPAPLVVPEGATRESFAFWLVGSTTPAPCTPPAVPSADGALCYTAADEVRLGADVIKAAAAKVSELDSSPYVAIEFSDEGVLRWRALAGRAFVDRGQIAIEFGGVVLSAPAVNDDFSDTNEATITGGFTRDEATQLARALAGR